MPPTAPKKAVNEDEVLHEFPTIGKYRVRLLKTDRDKKYLDIREHVSNNKFTGFTRRGIRINIGEELDALRGILLEVKDDWR